ncbi:hypothetical protein PFLUV_G00112950 [Perca fluviatilis]|uniref:Uncharacterized protein n=1 Tax=Perca fluviatilis TaxID=8168 RepID=A0A6A5E9W6_PERFL|nr:hypothetical protein PFLUV_G00112950 [Perca fluviatilis]
MKESRQRGESSLSSSSEEDEPSTTRQRVRRFESPSSSSSEDKQPATPRRQQVRRFESPSSSSSKDHQRSTTRQQERNDVSSLFFVGTNMKERRRKGESPLSCAENMPSTTSARKEREIIEREKQRLEEEGLKRERERCEKMKRKNQEKERKTFGLRSRMYIWWLNGKIDNIARDIQSTFVDESYLLLHDPLRNPEKMADKRRQEFKMEREVGKQRLKVERKEINAKKMENISELCSNSESRHMLNLRSGPNASQVTQTQTC